MDATFAAGLYLICSIQKTRKISFICNLRTDEEAPSYNLARHTGTLYSLACLYHLNKDPELLQNEDIPELATS